MQKGYTMGETYGVNNEPFPVGQGLSVSERSDRTACGTFTVGHNYGYVSISQGSNLDSYRNVEVFVSSFLVSRQIND